jgi:hypothetical protein
MSSNDIHGIEQGWSVKTADGQDAGSVEETTDTYILVKSGLLNAQLRYLPAATLAHVRPELKEIDVSVTNDELEAGDWSQPPAHGPRAAGAPLNEEAYQDDATPIPTIRDPEKPITM